MDGRRTLGSLGGSPDLCAGNAQPGALADGRERQPEIKRPARFESRPDIRLQSLLGQRQLQRERAAGARCRLHREIAVVHSRDLS